MRTTTAAVRISMLAVALVLSFGVGGCAGDPAGPGEDALLPAKDLIYPGGVVEKSHFFEASDAKGIDQDLSSDASLDRTVVFEEPVNTADVLAWYKARLEAAGWGKPFEQPISVTMRKQDDGIEHTFEVKVDAYGDDNPETTTKLFIDYRMVFFTPKE